MTYQDIAKKFLDTDNTIVDDGNKISIASTAERVKVIELRLTNALNTIAMLLSELSKTQQVKRWITVDTRKKNNANNDSNQN